MSQSSTLAIRVAQSGDPSVLQPATFALPPLAADAVRICQHAIGVNFVDVYQRNGFYPVPLPAVLGVEGAGVIEAVGSAVTAFHVGQRVAWAGASIGGYTSVLDLPAERAIALSDAVATDAAGGSLLRGITVYMLLQQVWPLKPGQTVLVHGAAGGLGLMLIQWAKALGARVIGTVSGPDKAALAYARGLDRAVDYRQEDFVAAVLDATDAAGADLVIDGIGGETLLRSIAAARPGGMVASIGWVSGAGVPAEAGDIAAARGVALTRPSVLGFMADAQQYRAGAQATLERLAAGLVIDIADHLPLAQASEAHRRLEAGEVRGALLLQP
ncbi:quinone oxidoreductase [Neisseriaceae bacterium JH1-16]|nr:quinone oxidoreductase [Neisseriaceae bacterium JH1-16]